MISRIPKFQQALLGVLVPLFFVAAATAQQRPALTVSVFDFHGVSRVIVETANGLPAANDVYFNVVVKVRDYRYQLDVISREGVLERGQTTAIVDIPFMQSRNSWTMYDVIVEQDGNRAFNRDSDLVKTNVQPNNGWFRGDWMLFVSSNIVSNATRKFNVRGQGKTSYATTAVGVSDAKLLPTFANSASVYQSQGLINQGTITSDLSVLQSQSIPIRCTHPARFFEDWKSLHAFKTVLISLADLKTIGKSAEKSSALRRWVSVGGNLVVFDVGDKFKRRNEVLKMLDQESDQVKWLQPTSGILDNYIANFPGNAAAIANRSGADFSGATTKIAKKLDDQRFVKSSILEGNLFLIPDDMTKWKASDWGALQNVLAMSSDIRSTLGSFTSDRYYLQGFSIPGIGKPPVLVFQVLIGLFVLVLGPLSYYLCQTSGRPYMLLVTTPAFALLSVAALLAYGIFSDGFGLKGRAHSVTRIDHSSGMAFTSFRQVFYSGISPGDCNFDADIMAIDSRAEFSSATQTTYRGDFQLINGGQIKARSPFQFSTLRCYESDNRLSLLSGNNGSVVTNGFPVGVELAIFRKGNIWLMAKNIAAQGTAQAEEVSLKQAHGEIYKHFHREMVNNLSVGSYRQNRWNYSGGGKDEWGYCSGVVGQLNRPDSLRKLIEPAHYVAIVDSTPGMPKPLPNVDYDGNQLHIIIGSR